MRYGTKTVQGIKPIVREHLARSYAERYMGGESHRPAVGFVLTVGIVGIFIYKTVQGYAKQ